MSIICITGAQTDSTKTPIWKNFAEPFGNAFPNSKFSVAELRNCSLIELLRWQTLIRDLVEKCNDGKGSILVGHSLGGIIACCVAAYTQPEAVRGVVTIFSPHLMFSLMPWMWMLPTPARVNVPIVSFHGLRDSIVWCGTEHDQSVEHIDLDCGHTDGLIEDAGIAKKIAAAAQRNF